MMTDKPKPMRHQKGWLMRDAAMGAVASAIHTAASTPAALAREAAKNRDNK